MSTPTKNQTSPRNHRSRQKGSGSTSEDALLIESITDYAIFSLDPEGFVVSWNSGATKLKGYLEHEILGKHISVFYPPEDILAKKPERELQIAIDNGRYENEGWRVRKDGSVFRANVIVSAMLNKAGKLVGFSKVTRDVTERYRAVESLRQAEEKYRRIFEDSVAGMFQIAPDGKLLSANPAGAALFGYQSPAELIAHRPNLVDQALEDPADRGGLIKVLSENDEIKNFEYRTFRSYGSAIWLMVNARIVRDNKGTGLYHEVTLLDVTERKVAEQKIHSLAYYDDVTGLPNRTLFLDRLSKALAYARRHKTRVALLYLDLDRFKFVNDSIGHVKADAILKSVATRLASVAREQDSVARIREDEFIALLPGIHDSSEAAIAASRFLDAMAGEFKVAGQSMSISCNIGISVFPDHGLDGETLIKNADWAVSAAKERGQNNIYCFNEDLGAKAAGELALGNALRLAIEKEQLYLVYQPQMNVASGRMVGLEALLRWSHPEFGLVPPDKFIPIAERRGLIGSIGEWVLRTACAQIRRWKTEGLPVVPVAVNVSAVQFRQWGFTELVARVLDETGLSSDLLELELTESLLLSTGDATFAVLKELSALGVKLSIDDFGTGYSSFSYLRQFPVSKLKIDRSFINHVAKDPNDSAITAAIISMAKQLHLRVLAEGVETEAQLEFLRDHGCDEIQGYYFSRPLTDDQIPDKLKTLSRRSGAIRPASARDLEVSIEPLSTVS